MKNINNHPFSSSNNSPPPPFIITFSFNGSPGRPSGWGTGCSQMNYSATTSRMLIGDAVVIITGILSALIDQTSKNHTFSSRGSLYNKIIYIYLCSLQALVLGFAVLVQVAIVGQWFYGEPPVVVQVPQSAGQNSTMSCCKTPVGQIVASLGYNKTCKILSLLSPISLLS